MNKIAAEISVKLNNIDDVYAFNEIARKQDFVIDARSMDRHYCLDAKSIMGLFSLDLSQPIMITTNMVDEKTKEFFEAIEKFRC